MNDDLGPEDRTLGTALSRAIEAQSVRGTQFEDSRLGVNMSKPKRGSFLLPAFAAIAAVLVGLFVGTSLLNRDVRPSGVASSPTPTATVPSAASPAPTSGPTQGPTVTFVVYFARDQLPPVAAGVVRPMQALIPETRIAERVHALAEARSSEVPSGATNQFAAGLPPGAQLVVGARIAGDVATVAIESSAGWRVAGTAGERAFIQQLVYTITEEPGIRRAMITRRDGSPFALSHSVLDRPLSREDVSGYNATIDERIVAEDEAVPATATTTVSNDTVAPALGRLAIELRASAAPSRGFWSPRFRAEMHPDQRAGFAKSTLRVTVPGVTDPTAPSTRRFDGSPILEVRTTQEQSGITYAITLTDSRPWRVAVERGAAEGKMRLLVDVGGHPQSVVNGTAVYKPAQNADVSRAVIEREITVSGVARAFEATVNWRLRDSSGREVANGFTNASVGSSPVWGTFSFVAQVPPGVTGNVTLDVYQASPRDGSDINKVELRLQVRAR